MSASARMRSPRTVQQTQPLSMTTTFSLVFVCVCVPFFSAAAQMCTDETCAEEGHGESTALSPLPLIFSYKSEKSLCGAGHGHGHAAAAAASAEAKESHGHGHAAAAHGHGHGANVKAKRKVHDLSRVGSVGIKLEGHLDNIKFNYFMGTLLRERSSDLYRSKGVLSIHGQV
eukprot:COSAG03_NODE_4065_length_1702_cov_3.159077_3_plen_172_part_00